MPIPDNVKDAVTLARDIFTILVAVGTLIAAVEGLQTWRFHLMGKTEYELARRLLRSVYKVREGINMVRGWVITEGEITEAVKKTDIPLTGERQIDDPKIERTVYYVRWQAVSEGMTDLDVDALEAEVLWGEEVRDIVGDFRKSVAKLGIQLDLYLRHKESQHGILDREGLLKVRKIVFSMARPEEDEFLIEVNEKISAIEVLLKPYLKIKAPA